MYAEWSNSSLHWRIPKSSVAIYTVNDSQLHPPDSVLIFNRPWPFLDSAEPFYLGLAEEPRTAAGQLIPATITR